VGGNWRRPTGGLLRCAIRFKRIEAGRHQSP